MPINGPEAEGRNLIAPDHPGDESANLNQAQPRPTIVLTPAADATVSQQQFQVGDAPATHLTAGPWILAVPNSQTSGGQFLAATALTEYLRVGLLGGGFRSLSGRFGSFGPLTSLLPLPQVPPIDTKETHLASVGAVEFDLTPLKAFLDQAGRRPPPYRASLILRPLRVFQIQEFLSNLSPPVTIPPMTTVAILDMAREQKDLIIRYSDLPQFAVGRTSFDQMQMMIRQAPQGRRAQVPTDLKQPAAPLRLDVTEAIRSALNEPSPLAGFVIASELNGTQVLLADSALSLPGSGIIAPQLVVEFDRAPSVPPTAQLVVSTTRLNFDRLRLGSRDVQLVTISNMGTEIANVTVRFSQVAHVDSLVNRGFSGFSLLPAPGEAATVALPFSTQIEPGHQFSFAVAYDPLDEVSVEETLSLLDVTDPANPVQFAEIRLSGLGAIDHNLDDSVLPIRAPIELPPNLSEGFVGVTGGGFWRELRSGLNWLLNNLWLLGPVGLFATRSVRRRSRRTGS
jgi:hypothetical protein